MDDYNTMRSQDFMTASIFSFLENLLAAVRTSETLASEANERDQVNVSNDIKPGGYSEDLFIFLSEREKEEYSCCVCYLVIKDVHQCSNGHKFCYSCIYVWSTCNRTGADCCPACRCEGIYARNEQLNEKISGKRVKCQDDGCNWRGFLRDYIEHEHRHYDFKELTRSVDLPNISSNDVVKPITPPILPPLELTTIPNTILDDRSNSSQTDNNLSIMSPENIGPNHNTNVLNSSRTAVSRTGVVPRRLSRLTDTVPSNIVRTVGPRSIVNPRQTTARCAHHANSNYLQPRPPRVPRNSRPNDQPSIPITTRAHGNMVWNRRPLENDERVNQNESTQTYNESVHEEVNHSFNVPPLPDLNHHHRLRNERQSPLFPPINSGNRNSVSIERPILEYRRLAPTYASRRQNMGYMNDGHEHFTRMLILLTSDLEDRIPTIRSQPRDPDSNSFQRNPTPQLPLNPISNSNNFPMRSPANRSNSRLQEFRNLNRRLSEVANSLDLLLESTSRQGASNVNSNDSSTSDTTSDTE